MTVIFLLCTAMQLPKDCLSALKLSTTNADITLPAVSVSDRITLSANGGDIDYLLLDVGNALTLEAKNGNISGTVLGTYEDFAIFCTTKKGECNLPAEKAEGGKALSVTANNGDVRIAFDNEAS